MNEKTAQKISQWKNYPNLDPLLRKELESLSPEALEDAFYEDLAFGTGGLRGVIGVGTNRMNIYIVRKTTLGFYQYLVEHYPDLRQKGVVISYDCRHYSQTFARAAAEVLASRGVRVYLFSDLRPTPELSFAIRHLKAAGGIMITASHNPPIYNGYKVYDHEGCQLIPELADEVIAKVNEIDNPFTIEVISFEQLVASGMISLIDKTVDDAYLARVSQVPKHFNVKVNNKKNIKIVFTPLHGTASVHMVKLLEKHGFTVIPVQEQMVPDPNFSTLVSPNPEEASAFTLAIRLGEKVDADYLIATDPDADRMGIAVKTKNGYQLLTGNQTGAIMLYFLAQYKARKKKGVVFNTIVTSNLAGQIAERYGLLLAQTLTGFKFIGAEAKRLEKTDEEFFFGFEESYGYVIEDFVRDKDSLQSTLALCYMASFYKEQGKTLLDVLYDIYEEFGYYLEDVHNIALTGFEGKKRIDAIMRYFQEAKFTEFAGKKIAVMEDYEKRVRYQNGTETPLTLPQSLVVKYIFDDGGWFVLRPSGTEPKLKIYIAIVGKTVNETKSFIDKLKQQIIATIERI